MSGLLYGLAFRKKNLGTLYASLLTAMVAGRVVWGVVKLIMTGIAGDAGAFTFAAFISGAITTALPGIIVQLVLIPAIVVALRRAKLID